MLHGLNFTGLIGHITQSVTYEEHALHPGGLPPIVKKGWILLRIDLTLLLCIFYRNLSLGFDVSEM